MHFGLGDGSPDQRPAGIERSSVKRSNGTNSKAACLQAWGNISASGGTQALATAFLEVAADSTIAAGRPCSDGLLFVMPRPAIIPAGSWPRRMPAELAAGYCGKSTVKYFLKRVGSEYRSRQLTGKITVNCAYTYICPSSNL